MINYSKIIHIYRLLFRVIIEHEANVVVSLQLLHERISHANRRSFKHVIQKGVVDGLQISQVKDFSCEACSFGKAHRIFFRRSLSEEKQSLVNFSILTFLVHRQLPLLVEQYIL